MKFKNNIIFLTIFIFLVIISSGIVFAEDSAMPLVDNGEVSGGVEISSVNPFTSTNGELVYEIPENVTEIKSVNVVVSSYSGSGAPTYGLTTNISLKTDDGISVLEYANLTYPDNTASDPVIYPMTNNTSKQYSDYQSLFDITDKVKNLSGGDTITITVNNTALTDYSFDGRIKLIALICAYDDSDNDKISYWLNIGQAWTKETLTTIFNTKDFDDDYDEVTLESIALSSADATYRLNGDLLFDPEQETGSYYIYDVWDITENFIPLTDTNLTYTSSKASTYASYKASVQLLKITTPEPYFIAGKITPPYSGTVFAGVNNTLTVTVTNGNIDFEGSAILLADGKEIAHENLSIDANDETEITFIDPTIRPIDETTVNGANNTNVLYTLNFVHKDFILNSTNASFKVLYNGNLGKDFAYPASNASTNRIYNITGDVIILTQDVYKYAGTGVTNVNYTFEVDSSDISNSLLYVAYNWDKIAGGDFNDWNITFNNQAITPIDTYRDQSNLGTYGKYGYGLLVYDVADLLAAGENVLVLNKAAGGCAVYPPTLLVLTENDESETYKIVYIAENADLLSKQVNLETGSYTFMDDIETADLLNSTLYVFAASGQAGEGNLIVNNNICEDIWNGTSSSYDYYMIDMINSTLENNVIYFEATGSTIVALQNVLVVEFERPIEISAPDVPKYYHGSERFVVTVTDYKGSPLANKSIEIGINNVNYTRTTDAKGIASIALELGAGVYDVDVTVDNQTVYSVVTILTTVNGTDITKVFRNDTQYYATFLDSQGKYLADGTTVQFNINGVMYDRKVSGDKGLARLNINLAQGEYIITAMNPVTGDKTSNNITVLPLLTENKDITKYYRNATQYTVKVLGADGKAVGANVTVKFNINGVFYERQTDASGIAKLNINLQAGDYVITAEYNGCTVSNNIKVLPILNATDITMKYRDGTQFKANLVDGQGKPYANQNVTFNINGVFYNKLTDGNGQAKLNINLIPGEYIITSSYNGCNIANTIKISA